MDINEKNKIVALWLSKNESLKQEDTINLKSEIEQYKKQKYRICVYQSGEEDLKTSLLNLILNNA